ncbi:MAG: hypothetical protein FWG63_00475 [Defluviitaleaceae bacterium]|nr:hypothetical protein [Defluviitaleaceae bacterium]
MKVSDLDFEVCRLYITEDYSQAAVADELGLRNPKEVAEILVKYGFKRGDKSKNFGGGAYKGHYKKHYSADYTKDEFNEILYDRMSRYKSGQDLGEQLDRALSNSTGGTRTTTPSRAAPRRKQSASYDRVPIDSLLKPLGITFLVSMILLFILVFSFFPNISFGAYFIIAVILSTAITYGAYKLLVFFN